MNARKAVDKGAEIALASIGICSPAFTAVTGFASLVGVGGAALMSISLGERNRKDAQQGMLAIVLGALLNIALDPVFIYVLNMGVVGAATATVISQFCVLFYVLLVLGRKSTPIRLGFGHYSRRICGKILSIGSMPFLIVVLDNMLIILLNAMLRKYGGTLGDQYISYAAVVQSVMVVAICPAEGLTNGCTTLFSYYYGSGNYKKILQCFRGVLLYSGLYLGGITAVILLKPEWLVRLFLSDATAIAQTAVFVQRYSVGFIFVAIQFAFVDGFTAMGMVKEAVPISFFRKGLYVAAVLLIPLFTPLEYIFYASAVSDCLGAAFTLLLYFCCLRKRLADAMERRTAAYGS